MTIGLRSLVVCFVSVLGLPAWADPMTLVSFSQEQFVSPDYQAADQQGFTFVGSQFRQNHLSTETGAKFIAEIDGKFSPSSSLMSYLNISQLAWGDTNFTVGRKKVLWSRLDESWGLGLYQPLFSANPISREAQGLSGIFLGSEFKNWGVRLFGSFIYVPNQGPGYDLKDGRFEKSNPWFQSPPQYVRFLGQVSEVNYRVQTPETNEIIFNRSFAALVYFGEEEGVYLEGAVASKPANQLSLGFDGYLTPNKTAEISVAPKVFYHTLASGEVSYRQSAWSTGFTALVEKPEEPNFDESMTYVYYRPSTLISPFVNFKTLNFYGALSYLKVTGGESELRGSLAPSSQSGSSSNAILPMRYPFEEATKMSLAARQNLKKRRILKETLSYTQGKDNLFSEWGAQGDLHIGTQYRVSLNASLLKAADTPEAQRTLIGQYQNNDRISAGVAYVF